MLETITERALSVISDNVIRLLLLSLAALVGGTILTQVRKLYEEFKDARGIIVSEPVLLKDRNRIRTFSIVSCGLQYAAWVAISIQAEPLVLLVLIVTTSPVVGAACPLAYKYLLKPFVFPLVAVFFDWARGRFK